MALTKCEYCDGVTPITAKNLNDIQDAVCDLERKAEEGGEAEVLIVTVTDTDGVLTASHNAGEIYAFVEAGGIAVLQKDKQIYPISQSGENECYFFRTFVSGGGNYVMTTAYGVGEDGTVETIDTTIASLKNPYALTIGDKSYDGSEAVSVDVATTETVMAAVEAKYGALLPSVTAGTLNLV